MFQVLQGLSQRNGNWNEDDDIEEVEDLRKWNVAMQLLKEAMQILPNKLK